MNPPQRCCRSGPRTPTAIRSFGEIARRATTHRYFAKAGLTHVGSAVHASSIVVEFTRRRSWTYGLRESDALVIRGPQVLTHSPIVLPSVPARSDRPFVSP